MLLMVPSEHEQITEYWLWDLPMLLMVPYKQSGEFWLWNLPMLLMIPSNKFLHDTDVHTVC